MRGSLLEVGRQLCAGVQRCCNFMGPELSRGFRCLGSVGIAVLVMVVLSNAAYAQGSTPTLADPGFTLTDLFTAYATKMGTYVAGALGVTLVFYGIWRAVKWLKG